MNKNRILNAVPAKPSKQTKRRTVWANDLSEELRAALEKSLIEARKGKMISHEDAMKQIKIMVIVNRTLKLYNVQKFNLFTPTLKGAN